MISHPDNQCHCPHDRALALTRIGGRRWHEAAATRCPRPSAKYADLIGPFVDGVGTRQMFCVLRRLGWVAQVRGEAGLGQGANKQSMPVQFRLRAQSATLVSDELFGRSAARFNIIHCVIFCVLVWSCFSCLGVDSALGHPEAKVEWRQCNTPR